MLVERAEKLKLQEERLGGVIAELQIAKAKEVGANLCITATVFYNLVFALTNRLNGEMCPQVLMIECQQQEIVKLKSSLMKDLQERGLLSDDDAKHILHQHQQDQKQLQRVLDMEKGRQEEVQYRGKVENVKYAGLSF